MKITIHLALFITMASLGLSACSKEKKIERSLQKKTGTWEVVNYHTWYYIYAEDTSAFENSIDNYATFKFFNNGKFESIGDKWYNTYEGTWINTGDELVVMGNDVDYYRNAMVYRIVEESKNEMTLKRTVLGHDIHKFREDETLRLKRK